MFRIDEPDAMIKCPSCSAEMIESNRFCGSCGSVLTPKPEHSMADTMAMPTRPPSTPRSSSPSSRPSSDNFDEGRFLPGTLVADRYRIIGLLGRGGMGEVYRATDLRLSQQVALKFLPESLAGDPDTLARFNTEVRIARQVSHPNVCRVYDIGEIEGQSYLSMEYVDGENMAVLLRRIGHLPHDKAVEIARKICAGLAAAHDKGVLHRDLKPANIMIDARGQVLITDFGLAGIANQIHSSEIRHGTPAYMAPEQLAGKEVSVRSDIYSLGLVLYEMFTGQRAFEANTLAELTRMQTETAPPSLASIVRDLDPAVERVVMRCLDSDPLKRPPSALAVAAALPGGDPLAAALAAGETPSPELVASASEREALRPAVALACLIATLAGIAAMPFLISQSTWITKTPFDTPPDALAQKARELIQRFGYTNKPGDTTWGFSYAADYLGDLDKKGKASSTLQHLAAGQPAPIIYWYRTSPRYLMSIIWGDSGTISRDDPPMDLSDMVRIDLDGQGHLVSFEAVPPQIDASSVPSKPIDGAALLTAAGLDPAKFQPTDPTWTPLASIDQRSAWTGTYPGDSNPLRVEAASWKGRLVFFALISPWTKPDRMQRATASRGQLVLLVIMVTVVTAIFTAACMLARRNIRSGKSDTRSATRLGGFLFLLSMIAWAFGTHHTASAREVFPFLMGMGDALQAAALMWILYVAVEPFVRRYWPQTIISWTRVFAGRFRDPVVGGHVLVGLLFGVIVSLLLEVISYLNFQSTGIPAQYVRPGALRGVAQVTSIILGIPGNSLTNTLGVFFLVFLLRTILRREWLAAIAFVLLLTAVGTVQTSTALWIAAPIRLIQYSLMIFVLLRFGLLSFAVGSAMLNILIYFPITTDFSAWYSGAGIFALALFTALAIYAFRLALANRPLFKSTLFE